MKKILKVLHTKVNLNSKVPEYINKEKFIFIKKMIRIHHARV